MFILALLQACSPEKQDAKPVVAVSTNTATLAPEKASFIQEGFISDSMCGAQHEGMLKTGSMGSTDASCVLECVKAGSKFVLVSSDTKHVWLLSDQQTPRTIAAKKVRVYGTLCNNGREIKVMKIEELNSENSTAEPHK